jgi:hypothetical protein
MSDTYYERLSVLSARSGAFMLLGYALGMMAPPEVSAWLLPYSWGHIFIFATLVAWIGPFAAQAFVRVSKRLRTAGNAPKRLDLNVSLLLLGILAQVILTMLLS